MAVIFWIILGATIGWIASILSGAKSFRSSLPSIYVGILGAVLGGLYVRAFDLGTASFGLTSVLMAIVGSIIVITSYKAVKDE